MLGKWSFLTPALNTIKELSTKKCDDAVFQISVPAAAQFLHKQARAVLSSHSSVVRRSLAMFARQCLLLHTSSATCVCFCITALLHVSQVLLLVSAFLQALLLVSAFASQCYYLFHKCYYWCLLFYKFCYFTTVLLPAPSHWCCYTSATAYVCCYNGATVDNCQWLKHPIVWKHIFE